MFSVDKFLITCTPIFIFINRLGDLIFIEIPLLMTVYYKNNIFFFVLIPFIGLYIKKALFPVQIILMSTLNKIH